MRYEVPQFIEVEDRIVGPFTWRQFVYLAGGAGGILIAFLTLPFILAVIIAIPFAGFAGLLAFQKVNNRPFATLLEAAFNFFTGKKMYLWKQTQQGTISGVHYSLPTNEELSRQATPSSAITGEAPIPRGRIAQALEQLDSDSE